MHPGERFRQEVDREMSEEAIMKTVRKSMDDWTNQEAVTSDMIDASAVEHRQKVTVSGTQRALLRAILSEPGTGASAAELRRKIQQTEASLSSALRTRLSQGPCTVATLLDEARAIFQTVPMEDRDPLRTRELMFHVFLVAGRNAAKRHAAELDPLLLRYAELRIQAGEKEPPDAIVAEERETGARVIAALLKTLFAIKARE